MIIENFPTYDKNTENLKNGMFFPLPQFCEKNFNDKCKVFYNSLEDMTGYLICPYGFTIYIKKIGTEEIIYTGLRIKDKYNRKKADPKIIEKLNYPVLAQNHFENLLEDSVVKSNTLLKVITDHSALKRRIEETEKIQKANSKFISDTLHEIRKLNAILKEQIEGSSRLIEQGNTRTLKRRIDNIFDISSLISIRLNSYDLLINPGIIDNNDKSPMVPFSKFAKIIHCMDTTLKHKNITHTMNGENHRRIQALDIFEILPYLLYDNAIKYSPTDQPINTTFTEMHSELSIEIESIGPFISQNELSEICQKDYRGKNAIKSGVTGTGIGLSLAKQICDLHSIEISFKSGSQKLFHLGPIDYSTFTVRLVVSLS